MPEHGAALDYVERTGGVQIEVPAQAHYVALVRLAVHSLTQRRDLEDERAEDVVLAVSEACTHLIGSGSEAAAGSLELRWWETEEEFTVEVRAPGGTAAGARPDSDAVLADPARSALEGDLSLPLIEALVDEVTAGPSDVRLRVLCPAWSPEADL